MFGEFNVESWLGHWFSVIELLRGYLSITVIRDRGTGKFNHLITYF